MVDHHHQHQVSSNDIIILEPSYNNKQIKKKNARTTSKQVIIDLNDDDGDCVLVKKEVNLGSKGNHRNKPICIIEENYEDKRKSNRNAKLCKNLTIEIDDSVKCVDDNDDVRIINVRPSSRTKRKPFSCYSSTEIGESSGSKMVENDELVTEIDVDPIEIMFLCEICADSKPRKEAFRIKGCSHSYCSDCMKTYVASKLQDGVSVINCPVPSCSGVLEPEYCREILPFEVFVRWGNLLCESVILASQKFYCPFKDCSALLVDDGNEKVTISECPSCFRLFCAQCRVAWHTGIGCAEYQSLSKDERDKDDIMLRKLAKSKNWQRCPKCKYYVEKSEGCLYMKCR
ncbi:hypothetical protein RDABS01_023507 [Bienertia sinuspersici]